MPGQPRDMVDIDIYRMAPSAAPRFGRDVPAHREEVAGFSLSSRRGGTRRGYRAEHDDRPAETKSGVTPPCIPKSK